MAPRHPPDRVQTADRMLDLDTWLPDPTVRTHRCRHADATPEALWSHAAALELAETRTLGRLIRWRIPGVPAERSYDELFRTYPFVVLEEGERHLVSGLCGKIWTLARDYPQLEGPDAFREWREPGTVRVLFAHWVTDDAQLCTEARVKPVDRSSAFRLQALWRLIGHFEPLVATEPLTLATRRAAREAPG
jgi:hypothetical protein